MIIKAALVGILLGAGGLTISAALASPAVTVGLVATHAHPDSPWPGTGPTTASITKPASMRPGTRPASTPVGRKLASTRVDTRPASMRVAARPANMAGVSAAPARGTVTTDHQRRADALRSGTPRVQRRHRRTRGARTTHRRVPNQRSLGGTVSLSKAGSRSLAGVRSRTATGAAGVLAGPNQPSISKIALQPPSADVARVSSRP